uniref:Gustatory receptor n=1 Tax=Stomoxys calcitrans TaxID=35570 RepID=A0A905STE2_STOCA
MKQHFQTTKQYCKQICQFFLIFVGLTSYWYDYKKADFKRNILSRLVFVTLNIIGIAININEDKGFLGFLEHIRMNTVLRYMTASRFIFIMLPPVCTFGQICLRGSQLVDIKRKLQSLETECRAKFASCKVIERKMGKLNLINLIIGAFTYIMTLAWNVYFKLWWLITILYANITLLSPFWMCQYFQVIAKICRLFYYIDKQLQKLLQDVTNSPDEMDENTAHEICLEIFWLRRKHFELCHLWQELETMSKWLICLKRLVSLISIGMHLYAVMAETRHFPIKHLLFYDLPDILPKILDFYVTDYLCDLTKQTFMDLQLTIRDLSGLDSKQPKLRREFEAFSLYLCFQKMNLHLSGPIRMGRRTWFAMMSAVTTCAIVLGQAHMKAA